MIHYEWRTEVTGAEREELDRLLTESAERDAEPGFPSFALTDPVPPGSRYLLVWLLPDERTGRTEPPPTLAACLRLEPDSAEPNGAGAEGAEVRMVVHPDLRARGISTLLGEQLGTDVTGPDGWVGTGCTRLRCWARGDHPAAHRMWRRLDNPRIIRDRRRWRLIAPLRPAGSGSRIGQPGSPGPGLDKLWLASGRRDPAPAAGRVLVTGPADAPHGAAWFDATAAEPTEFGPAGLITAVLVAPEHAENGTRAGLLDAAMAAIRRDGSRVAAITVDERDRGLVTDCRLAGFQHERTDIRYHLR
ncbi:hypothetical protein GCM10023321_56440 [Pseudonocardia eucalypti]|uniref:GNAT family N-acetyltransferase n=1 Tax=Pseudonocardia eucalypti TaxID=648755 RepID=A0ABP9QQN7_9PSEU|nr:mycothiol synthase [Pseudonocardia eucalypti]